MVPNINKSILRFFHVLSCSDLKDFKSPKKRRMIESKVNIKSLPCFILLSSLVSLDCVQKMPACFENGERCSVSRILLLDRKGSLLIMVLNGLQNECEGALFSRDKSNKFMCQFCFEKN